MSESALLTRVVVKQRAQYRLVHDVFRAVKSMPSVFIQHRPPELLVMVCKPPSLEDAPPGTHEFAAGWISRGEVDALTTLLRKLAEPTNPGVTESVNWYHVTTDQRQPWRYEPPNAFDLEPYASL